MFRKLLVCAALVAGSVAANAGTVLLDEGFDDFTLPDWFAYDLNAPGGESFWFEGNEAVFAAQSGAPGSYIGANAFAAPFGSNVDSWLITPLIHAANGSLGLDFATRTEGAIPGDNLEVFVNSAGTLNTLADWVSLGSIGAYPSDWTFFNFVYTGAVADVRFAFRYTVTDNSVNGDYIGLDSVKISVPEPGTLALMAMGMLLTPLVLRRRRSRI